MESKSRRGINACPDGVGYHQARQTPQAETVVAVDRALLAFAAGKDEGEEAHGS